MSEQKIKDFNPTKEKIHEIIFEAETPVGKLFDIALLIFIMASVFVVMLESVSHLHAEYGTLFYVLEWFFTIFFTIEYILRLYCVYRPMKYATSFFGIIDLLAILPTYLSIIVAGTHYLMVIRALRLLRVFRIFKLGKYIKEGNAIILALKASRNKISIFLYFILLIVTVVGSVMYFIEGGYESGFTSIPRSIYWAIVTITTVGYGDIAPVTEVGQLLAAILMIMGYAVIAVPTGIVSAEFVKSSEEVPAPNTKSCPFCSQEGHADDAEYCKYCGEHLHKDLT